MEILWIIIVIVFISIVSAAGKKKPKQSSEDAPVRPTISDIQRAFMMATDDSAAPQHRAPETQNVMPRTPVKPAAPLRETVSSQPMQSRVQSRYADIDLSTFHTDNSEIEEKPVRVVKKQKSALRLFEDKNDYVRAVIYSEILARKGR